MSLGKYRLSVQIAVSDMGAAIDFYERKLGLQPYGEQREGSRTYACGQGTVLHAYAAPAHAGRTTGTVARFDVTDELARVVDELAARGVAFESYDDPVKTDERGIHDSGYGGKVAWFKDPDGNTFALEQV